MKVLFLCGREPSYVRNRILLNALSKNSEIINISSSHKNYISRYLVILWRLIFLRKDFDLVYIGFYGQPLVLITRFLTKRPIIFDAFISTYQTVCFDRKKFEPKSIIGRVLFSLDKVSCEKASTILLDTNQHIDYFVETFKLCRKKFVRVFESSDESIFFPREGRKNEIKVVFFYGQFQRLHGIEYIVKAAKLLEKEKVLFKIVGRGQESEKIKELSSRLKNKNIEFIDWISYKNLPTEIANSDICIGGHMGTTQKAKMVIPGKLYQFVSMKKPTIVALNKANLELFSDPSKPFFVTHGDEKDLAAKLKRILNDKSLSESIAEEQNRTYNLLASNEVVDSQVSNLLKKYE